MGQLLGRADVPNDARNACDELWQLEAEYRVNRTMRVGFRHETGLSQLCPDWQERTESSTLCAVHPDVEQLCACLRIGNVVALTGAGVSTESGIPDYRSPAALAKARRPIQGPEFVRSASLRQRYWARAVVGWERFRLAQPGPAHHALASLERAGLVRGIVTQNVDRLHHAAGSTNVTELHGALAEVVCLGCGALAHREAIQREMRARNPVWFAGDAESAPDGDAALSDADVAGFDVAPCARCGGDLKPNVVFFGHNVPRPVVDQAFTMVDAASSLVVIGTSLTVFSGYRFLRRAVEKGIPVFIVNRGPVRGEEHAKLKIEESTGATLAAVAASLNLSLSVA